MFSPLNKNNISLIVQAQVNARSHISLCDYFYWYICGVAFIFGGCCDVRLCLSVSGFGPFCQKEGRRMDGWIDDDDG